MDNLQHVTHIDNVRLSDDGHAVVILDQTQLPNRTVYLTLDTPEQLFDAIRDLKSVPDTLSMYWHSKFTRTPARSFLQSCKRRQTISMPPAQPQSISAGRCVV